MATTIEPISQTISTIPALRHRSTVNPTSQADKDDFVIKYEANNDHLANNTVSELNTLKGQVNTTIGQINTAVATINTQTETATAQAQTVQSAANFKGKWQDLSGALTVPSSVFHNGAYWMLLENVANVSANTPSEFSTVWAELEIMQEVARPTPIAPLNGATNVSPSPTLEASGYLVIYSGDVRANRIFEVDLATGDFTTPVYTFSGDVDSHTVVGTLPLETALKWRCKDVSLEGRESQYSTVQNFSTGAISVATPTLTVTGTPTDVPETPTLETSAFAVVGGSDTHLNTDWQILNDQLVVVWESLADASNKLSITVPAEILETSKTYTFRGRHRGNNYGVSAWAMATGTTKSAFSPMQGQKGFSVAPTDQPFALLGLAEMTGTNDTESDNYGNYIHTNGSIVCWIPKSYYRVGHPDSPRYATYGENALDFEGTDVLTTEAEANAAGYVLPRVFINAGKEQPGAFVDKYMNSKDGTDSSKSVFGGVPISLATTAGYTVSSGMAGCTGILADAVVLSKTRGERWNATSAFIYGYLALVSVAQAQAATSTADVAWYDATGVKNYPKGCNNNALSDVDDTTVVYASAGDSGNANKPKTGATQGFAKTTHNGSANGVADLNGGMFEVTIGITNFGSSATATTVIANDSIYVLKHSTDIATLTGGWNGATDVWGDATNLATKYDPVRSPHPLGSSTGTVYWGNSTNAVLQNDLSGVNRDVCGFIPKNSSSTGATGANLFGNDQLSKQNIQNMTPLACGHWHHSATAGVFYRNFYYGRSNSVYYCGFRASAYFA